jgi:hypothetical protein
MPRAWRRQHGNWCPGYGRDAHPAGDLTVDHVVPLAAAAPFDIAHCGVLCRSCNSTKGDGTRARSAGPVALVGSGVASVARGPTWAPTGEREGIR